MDSNRLLQFAIEHKMQNELNTSYASIKTLCEGKTTVKKIFKQKSSTESDDLTALCDLLTIMILAIDKNQRLNNKPTIDSSEPSSEHSEPHNHGDYDEVQKLHKTGRTTTTNDMEIDPTELENLEYEFKNQESKELAGMA
jgi:hypothetical protein